MRRDVATRRAEQARWWVDLTAALGAVVLWEYVRTSFKQKHSRRSIRPAVVTKAMVKATLAHIERLAAEREQRRG